MTQDCLRVPQLSLSWRFLSPSKACFTSSSLMYFWPSVPNFAPIELRSDSKLLSPYCAVLRVVAKSFGGTDHVVRTGNIHVFHLRPKLVAGCTRTVSASPKRGGLV